MQLILCGNLYHIIFELPEIGLRSANLFIFGYYM